MGVKLICKREIKMIGVLLKTTSRRVFSLSSKVAFVRESQLSEAIRSSIPEAQDVNVRDISDGCGSNFEITVVSNTFDGKRAVNRQRMVNKAIKEFLPQIHRVHIHTFTEDFRLRLVRLRRVWLRRLVVLVLEGHGKEGCQKVRHESTHGCPEEPKVN